jgi:hypothetical protein
MAKVVSTLPRLILNGALSDKLNPKPAATPAPVATPATTDLTPDIAPDLGNGISERQRGRTSTITTSFRGVLNDTALDVPRRTLLGE